MVEQRVIEIIEPSLNGLGFDLVRVKFQQGTLQIMAERREDGTLSAKDCADISRTVSALLDVADPIKSRYMLEVSSPGMDRPLTRLSDYERFSGKPARIETQVALDGRKKFTGTLCGANGANVRIEVDGVMVEVPFADIAQGRLDLSSELLKPKKPITTAPKKTPRKPDKRKQVSEN